MNHSYDFIVLLKNYSDDVRHGIMEYCNLFDLRDKTLASNPFLSATLGPLVNLWFDLINLARDSYIFENFIINIKTIPPRVFDVEDEVKKKRQIVSLSRFMLKIKQNLLQ